MPIAKFQMPDGRIGRFEVPEGTTPEQAQAEIEKMVGSGSLGQPQAPADQGGMFDDLIKETAAKYGLDSNDLSRQVQAESSGDPNAVSPAGAMGLMQLMPGTAKDLGVKDPFNAAENLDAGARYMRQLLDRYQGDKQKAYAAYNWGMGNVDRKGLEAMPEETRNYVAKLAAESAGGVSPGQAAAGSEIAKVIDNAVRGGLSALPQMVVRGAGQISDMGTELANTLGLPSIPGLRDIPSPTQLANQGLEAISSPLAQPETEAGKVAGRIGQAALSGLVFPGAAAAPGQALLTGGIAGAGSELGGLVGEQSGGETGELIGSIAGGVLAPVAGGALASRISNPAQRMARTALENVDDWQLAVAKANMQEARDNGINLTLAQAMPKETNIDVLEQMLVKTKAGEALARQLRDQPAQVQEASQRAVKALPGQIRGEQEMANIAQREADAALGVMRKERTEAVTPLYERAGKIPLPAYKSLREAIKAAGQTDRAKTLTKLYNKLNPLVKQADGKAVRKPITDVQLIDDTLRELEKKMSNKPKDPRAAALIQAEIGKIRDNLSGLSRGYREGSEAYAKITKEVINPAKQGPLGQVAQTTGYDAARSANRTNLFGIFDRGSAEGGRSEILTLQRDMAKAKGGNEAFVDAGKSWLSDRIQSAIKFEGGNVSNTAAADIEKALFGTSAQIKGTQDVLAGMARSQGVPEADLVNGFQNVMRTVRLASKRPPSATGLSAKEIKDQGESLATAYANSSFLNALVNPLRKPLLKYGQGITDKADAEIARLLSTPEGISALKEMAKIKPGSSESLKWLQRWNATMANQTAEE